MFRLSKRAKLGLYVMVELAREPAKQRSNEGMAAAFAASVSHLAKVTQTLTRARYLVGSRGVGGGYRLLVDPKTVSMADVIALFEGRPHFDRCSLGEQRVCAHQSGCYIKSVMREIEEHATYTLDSVTIYMLARPTAPAPRSRRLRVV